MLSYLPSVSVTINFNFDRSKLRKTSVVADDLDETNRIMRPIIFLFMLNGINVKKTSNKIVILFALLFHTMAFGIIALKIICLFEEFQWYIFVTVTMKVSALVIWWITWLKRDDIKMLIHMIEPLYHQIAFKDSKKIQKQSKIASLFLILTVFALPGVLNLRYTLPQGEIPNCIAVFLPNNLIGRIAVILLHEFASIYMNLFITCTVAIFYSIYCTSLSFSLKKIPCSETEAWQMNQKIIEIFEEIENVLSLIIFIVFGHIFASLFKDMVILIMIWRKGRFIMLYFYLLDFIINSVVAGMIVFSAEFAQRKANAVRESLFSYTHFYHHTAVIDLNRKYIKLSEDRKRLRLTGWGMFRIQKPLLISILTWLITYGVIILQFS